MTSVTPIVQQGVISTQVERVVADRPTAAEAPRPEPREIPPPPPAETGRGTTLDTSA